MPIRFNDIDLVAFLKLKGIEHSFVEMDNNKVYFHYSENVDNLIKEFESGLSNLNVKEYTKIRKSVLHISKMVMQQKNPKNKERV